MPIGSIFKYINKSNSSILKQFLKNLYFSVYGIPDFHTHIRWRAVKRFIDFSSRSILDVGCGVGAFAFEIASKIPSMRIIGIDTDEHAIELANSIKVTSRLDNVEFYYHDANKPFPFPESSFDMVWLIDVLEHIQNDSAVISDVSRILKRGGYVLVSVPTPNYPRFFGKDFHLEIGHIRDGYWLEDLARLLSKHNLSVISHTYYTWVPSAFMCGMFYRYLRKNKISFLLSPILNTLSFLDILWPVRNPKFSCSLLVKAQNREK